MVRFLFKSLEYSVTPYNCSLTVNARINARGAYLIFWVERGGGGERLFCFLNFGLRLTFSFFQVNTSCNKK